MILSVRCKYTERSIALHCLYFVGFLFHGAFHTFVFIPSQLCTAFTAGTTAERMIRYRMQAVYLVVFRPTGAT